MICIMAAAAFPPLATCAAPLSPQAVIGTAFSVEKVDKQICTREAGTVNGKQIDSSMCRPMSDQTEGLGPPAGQCATKNVSEKSGPITMCLSVTVSTTATASSASYPVLDDETATQEHSVMQVDQTAVRIPVPAPARPSVNLRIEKK
jgi:hypothetical protein